VVGVMKQEIETGLAGSELSENVSAITKEAADPLPEGSL